ncbi:G-protein coupled receptor 22-like [Octopus sinensis]|uniref:G-protein coupled receptor 22-like n=1 Tax=Octopus sinensis TaxID=2607531 RepID=A0A6P7TDS6_9MOLL|nr:G-protein coupled receptor 22-like [Octopus sinensis]XP_036367905.1 G-protein coupled receptor 22-like [Octopus sinensis]
MESSSIVPSEISSGFIYTLSMALVIECIGGLVCNLIVLITYHKSFKTQKTDNFLIINLNIVDILICVTAIPLTLVLLQSYQGQCCVLPCFFHQANITFVSTASAITLLTISIDRYEAVVTPLRKKIIQSNMKKTLLAIWTSSLFGLCSPFIGVDFSLLPPVTELHSSTLSSISPNSNSSNSSSHELHKTFASSKDVTESTEDVNWQWKLHTCQHFIYSAHFFPFHDVYFMLYFFLCMTGMIVCYYYIFRVAKQRLAVRLALIRATLAFTGGSTAEESIWKLQDRRLTKMTLAIVSSFIICWGPHIIISCISIALHDITAEMLRFIGLVIAFSTALLHPLLYTFMRQDFQRALRNRWMTQRVLRRNFRNRKIGTDASATHNGSIWTLTRDTINDTTSAE